MKRIMFMGLVLLGAVAVPMVKAADATTADPRLREVQYDPGAVVTVPVKRGERQYRDDRVRVGVANGQVLIDHAVTTMPVIRERQRILDSCAVVLRSAFRGTTPNEQQRRHSRPDPRHSPSSFHFAPPQRASAPPYPQSAVGA